eukprot:1133719-Heterocapsa_arctica.AAC.1
MGPGIREVTSKVEVVLNAKIATHRPVRATLKGNPLVQEVMALTVPRPYVSHRFSLRPGITSSTR